MSHYFRLKTFLATTTISSVYIIDQSSITKTFCVNVETKYFNMFNNKIKDCMCIVQCVGVYVNNCRCCQEPETEALPD